MQAVGDRGEARRADQIESLLQDSLVERRERNQQGRVLAVVLVARRDAPDPDADVDLLVVEDVDRVEQRLAQQLHSRAAAHRVVHLQGAVDQDQHAGPFDTVADASRRPDGQRRGPQG